MPDLIASGDANRNQLRQIVADLAEGVMLLDAGGTVTWSNAAAVEMHGVNTLKQLGASVAEYQERFMLRYRNNHPLEPEQYPIARVAAGETFTGVVVEVVAVDRPDERWVHEARSLVLTDGAGEPDCLVLFLVDRTSEVSAEERFERAFGANPAPAIICRLADLRHTKVNRGFLEMTGYGRDEVVGRSVYDIDVLEGADDKARAVALLHEGRTIPQMEAELRVSDGGRKAVIVAGQPIEIGADACMLFTFIDLESRRRAERQLRQTEERLTKAFNLSPLPSAVTTLTDGRFQEANAAFLANFGYAAEEVIGQFASELGLWVDGAQYRRQMQTLRQHGSLANQDIRVRAKGGQVMDCLMSAYTFTVGGVDCVLSTLLDVTERRRNEAELIGALDSVMQDTSWFSQKVIEKLAQLRQPGPAADAGAGLADLTAREISVLSLMCEALDDQAIADRLRISRNTVRNHVSTIYRKIDVHNRGGAIVWARNRGISGGTTGGGRRGKAAGR